jgi:hypothetical protein
MHATPDPWRQVFPDGVDHFVGDFLGDGCARQTCFFARDRDNVCRSTCIISLSGQPPPLDLALLTRSLRLVSANTNVKTM